MYGTQTVIITTKFGSMFENDVKMYGTQTYDMDKKGSRQFFNISLEITE